MNLKGGGKAEARTGRGSRRGGGGKCNGSWLSQESRCTWDVGGGVTWWRERSRKDEWTGSAGEDVCVWGGGGTGKVTGMTVEEKREV